MAMLRTILATLAILAMLPTGSQAQLVVIAHPSVNPGVATKASIADLYALTTTTWPDGMQVVVLDLRRDLPEKRQFYAAIGKDPVELRKSWMRAVLMGGVKAPQGVDTEEEMLTMVASTPGAVGYLSAAKTTPGVKVILRLEPEGH